MNGEDPPSSHVARCTSGFPPSLPMRSMTKVCWKVLCPTAFDPDDFEGPASLSERL